MIVSLPAWMERRGRWTLRAGLGALGLGAMCALFAPQAALHSYLSAFVLWAGIPLGCGAILMMHHLVGGRWGSGIRPPMEAAAMTTPLLAVLFVPVAMGISYLYPWASAAGGDVLTQKRAYLNVPFFLLRGSAFLLLWSAGAWFLTRRPISRLAAPGLVLYVLTVSFAAIDWIGSLEPHWYSSIFGLYVLIGQVLSALAVLIVLAAIHAGNEPSAADIFHDLGTLLLALVSLHAYFAYSQFFIIWNGNLPHEIGWYAPRIHGPWGFIALVLIAVHFALPFALLLSRSVKRRASSLLCVALVILIARGVEAMWIVLPSYDGPAIGAVALSMLAILGMGGIWMGIFARSWRRREDRARAAARAEEFEA